VVSHLTKYNFVELSTNRWPANNGDDAGGIRECIKLVKSSRSPIKGVELVQNLGVRKETDLQVGNFDFWKIKIRFSQFQESKNCIQTLPSTETMNLNLILISALSCGYNAMAAKMHDVRDEVSTSFTVQSDLAPAESAETSAFVGQCITSSFNKAHSGDDYVFDSAELESESIGPAQTPRGYLGCKCRLI
jgi:hypothetical protein